MRAETREEAAGGTIVHANMFSKSKKPPSGNCQCNHFFKYGCQGVMLS